MSQDPQHADAGTVSSPAGVVVALRRVVVGYRLVAALWLTALAGVALAAPGATAAPQRPAVVVAVTVVVWSWSVITVLLATVGSRSLGTWWWLAADTAVAAAAIVAPQMAGSDPFFGGYPFSAVLFGAYARGMAGGLVVAGTLAAVSLSGLAGGAGALPGVVGLVLFYLAGAVVSAWGVRVIRRNEAERVAAEDALAEERAARVRTEERAATAAHLHDSVLQTLALIQRRAGDAGEVTALARRQERELREWLYGAADTGRGATLAGALAAAADEVEQRHRITVEVVTVGDATLDEAGDALVAATCEALVNAAKHAGVDRVDLYAEASPEGTVVFVRDRGRGFDPATVPEDRRGLRDSIEGRLRAHGGEARIRAAPGRGTEVELRMAPPGASVPGVR
jgi:signal transduction histidine kinase